MLPQQKDFERKFNEEVLESIGKGCLLNFGTFTEVVLLGCTFQFLLNLKLKKDITSGY